MSDTTLEQKIVDAMLRNLRGRRGIRQAFESIDEDVMTELVTELREVVQREMLNHAGWSQPDAVAFLARANHRAMEGDTAGAMVDLLEWAGSVERRLQ